MLLGGWGRIKRVLDRLDSEKDIQTGIDTGPYMTLGYIDTEPFMTLGQRGLTAPAPTPRPPPPRKTTATP